MTLEEAMRWLSDYLRAFQALNGPNEGNEPEKRHAEAIKVAVSHIKALESELAALRERAEKAEVYPDREAWEKAFHGFVMDQGLVCADPLEIWMAAYDRLREKGNS